MSSWAQIDPIVVGGRGGVGSFGLVERINSIWTFSAFAARDGSRMLRTAANAQQKSFASSIDARGLRYRVRLHRRA
jgi:hypothetical protein